MNENLNQTKSIIDQIYNTSKAKKNHLKFKTESDFKIAYGKSDYQIHHKLPIKTKLREDVCSFNECGDCCEEDHDYFEGNDQIDSEYDGIKQIRSNCLLLEQNNNDLEYAIKRLNHENNCLKPRIEQLQQLNQSFLEDNAEYLGRSVENKFLIKDVTKMKDLLSALTKAVNDEMNNHCKLQEEYYKTDYSRKQFERDKIAYELSSIATMNQVDSLTNKKAFLENCKEDLIKKKLFINRLQEIKGLFRVIVKINPSNFSDSKSSIFTLITDDKVGIKLPYSTNCDVKLFQFYHVFNVDSTISDMTESLNSAIQQIMSGYNACLVNFGTSGSGKTYSSIGDLPDNAGLSSFLVGKLINDMNAEYRLKFKIEASFLEFYGDQVFCLVNKCKIKFRDTTSRLTIGKYGTVKICSLKDFNHALYDVAHRRQTSSTNFSPQASRSHLAIIVNVKSENTVTTSCSDSRLMIFDLAGFEKTSVNTTEKLSKQHLDEAFHINNSLSCFTQIIEELSMSNSMNKVRCTNIYPFRSSKLTQFLKPSLCGDSYFYLILHVTDNLDQVHSIYKTLQLGQSASSIELGKPLCHKSESIPICTSKLLS